MARALCTAVRVELLATLFTTSSLDGAYELECEELGKVDGELVAFLCPGTGEVDLAGVEGKGTIVFEVELGCTGLDAGLGKELVALLLNGAGTGRCCEAGKNIV